MPLTSYRVDSPVYIGPPSSVTVIPKKIAPQEIKSNKLDEPGNARPNVASYPWGEYKVIIERGPHGELYAVTRTANKTYRTLLTDFFKHGYFSQQDDYEIEGMKSAGEDNPPNKYHDVIPKMANFAYIEGMPSRLSLTYKDTPVNLDTTPIIVNAVHPNKDGFYASKKGKLEQTLRSMFKGGKYYDESAAWIEYLAQKGYSIETSRNPGVRGLGIENGDFIAAYYPGKDKGYLITDEHFYKKAKALMSNFGLSDSEAVEAMQRSILLHEFGHVVGIGGRRISEKLQGLLQAEFYSIMSNLHKGTKLEKIYRALAEEGKDYAREFSLLQKIWDKITANPFPKQREAIDDVIDKFLAEAYALGIDESEIQRYVDSRAIDTFGALIGGEPSYKGRIISKHKSSKSNNSKNSNKKELDEIVKEESNRITIAAAEDGQIVRRYNGSRVYGEGASMPEELIVGKGKEYKNSNKETYETRINKSEYKSMSDARAKRKEVKDEKNSDKAEIEANEKDAPSEEAPKETAEAASE